MALAAASSSLGLGWISSPSCRYSYSRSRVRFSLKTPPATPWLILPPEETSYKFYSVAEDRVLSLKKKDGAAAPPHDALLVGSSHGWLALWDEESNRVFLSNPISGCHLRLPPTPWQSYSRVILSGSPDEDGECYAVQDWPFPPAYCAVDVSTEWTQLDAGERLFYGDVAYCSSRRALSLITQSMFDFDSDDGVRVFDDGRADHQIDDWDLGSNSMVETTWFWKFQGPPHQGWIPDYLYQNLHLVYAVDGASSPLIVVRFVSRDGDAIATAGFLVLKIDGESRSIRVVDDLKGMALFVGANHSFAIPAAGMLKPNSIYFAPSSIRETTGNNDAGIFDYESKTFSRFININNKLKLQPNNCLHDWRGKCPMWFTPT
ncbi:hypothetical protein OROHE_000745 [Orobanche hederae]